MWIWRRIPYWCQLGTVAAFGLCGLSVVLLQWAHEVPQVLLGVGITVSTLVCLVRTRALTTVLSQPLWVQAASSCAVAGGAATILAFVLIAGSAVIATALGLAVVVLLLGGLISLLGD